MRGIQATAAGRVISVALSGALLLGNLGTGASVAFAEDPPKPTPPSVVREVIAKRTETSKTYLLSDGSFRAELHADPVNYENAAGNLVPIDTHFVVSPDDPAMVKSAATPVTVELGAQDAQAPVELSTARWSASFDLQGAAECRPLAIGNTAVYSEVQPGVDLTYRSISSGIKETLTLDSPSAPSTYSFKVSLDGLELRKTPLGSYAAYEPGASEPSLAFGSLTVWDSSKTGPADEPSYCGNASMTVESVDGGAIVTYNIDPEWLASPTRVFPVVVDPTLTVIGSRDTFVKDKLEETTTAFGSLDYIRCGRTDSSTGHNRAYVHFDTSALASATVSAATLKLNRYDEYDNASSNRNVYVAQLTSAFDDATSWSTKPGQGAYFTYTTMPSSMGWVNFAVTSSIVQGWVNNPATNYGLSVYESEGGTQDKFMNWFYAREISPGSGPRLDVTYTQSVPAATTAATATASGYGWFNQADTDDDQIGDARADTGTKGRGAVSLQWNAASGAAGYKIYAHDGATFRQVGQVQGSASTTWSSAGGGVFPSDSEVASLAAGANGFAPAASPSASSRETSFVAKNSVGADLGGAGNVASDGTNLYIHRWGAYGGPSTWTKVSSGLKGTPAAGTYIGEVGPVRADSRSGFYLDGFLYTGRTSSANAQVITGIWKDSTTSSPNMRSLMFSQPLLDVWRGTNMTTADGDTQLASDGTYIYSAAMSRGLYKGYDGWKVRVFDADGQWVRDFTVPGPSYYTNGFMVDGKSAYFIEWTSTDSARVTKASLADGRLQGQWTLDQGASQLINGCYDAANDCFWMGRLDTTARISRFSGLGLDLRDNPNALYKAVAPTGPMASSTSYAFKVAAYNQAGTAPLSSCATITTQLPNRTLSANADPRHTEYELGTALDDEMTAVLDEGALGLSSTDLSIKSWGPEAEISRSYSSTDTGSGRLAPGWRFSFDETLTQSGALATYTDSLGEHHSFVETGGVYVASQGFYSTLTTDATSFILTDKDRSATRFDRTSGRITSTTDANNNTVVYSWPASNPGTLTITAANGQQILVGFDSTGDVVRARYATADGERAIAYDSVSAAVVRNPGVTGQERTVTYTYSGGALVSLTVSAPGSTLGTWGFEYSGGTLSRVDYPGYPSDAGKRAAIIYGSRTATVTRTGRIQGADTDITESFWWNPTGTMRKHTSPKVSGEADATWMYEYAPGNEAIIETSPAGAAIRRTVDASGNTCFEWDEEGHQTSYLYDGFSNCVRETDPRGCTTYRTYDASGNLSGEQKQLNEYERSEVEYTRNASGTVTSEARSLTSTQSAVTNYSEFGPSGEAGQTTDVGVLLYLEAAPLNLTASRSFDAFGNVTSETNALGVTTVTNEYSPTTMSLLVSATDATGTATNHEYDAYGRDIRTWRSHGNESGVEEMSREYDPTGNVVTESYPGDMGVARVVAHTFDALSREVESDDAKVAGKSVSHYDARGNVLQSWAEGSDLNSQSASTRSVYDIYGQETSRVEPGSVASATLTSYFANGLERSVNEADGTRKAYFYDEAGNKVREDSSSSEGTVTATSGFDMAGRQTSYVDEEGNSTTYTYDLADRQIRASAGATPSVTTYNTLGQVLSLDDSDGAKSTKRYDPVGRVTSETVAGATTWATYDDLGRQLCRTNPDGSSARFTYDAFGRTTTEVQANAYGTTRDVATSYDALSRAVASTDQASGTTRRWEYAQSSGHDTTITVTRKSGLATTALLDSVGNERSRQAVLDGLAITRAVTSTDSAGRQTTWTLFGQTQSRTFDAVGHLTAQYGTGMQAAGATYAYSAEAGRKVSESIAHTGPETATTIQTYGYSPTGRLVSWNATELVGAGNRSETATYDAAGNITKVTASVPVGSLPATLVTFAYTDSRVTTRTGGGVWKYSYDTVTGARLREGTSTVPSRITYTWAPGVRLEHYRDASRSVDATYTYDANGQRTCSVVTSGSLTTTSTYVYEGLELLSMSATSSAGATYSIEYVHDAAGRPYSGYCRVASGTTAFGVVTNDRGDVIALSDDEGVVFAQYAYDPWGNQLSLTTCATERVTAQTAKDIATRQPLRYAGYCFDAESGLYYLSQRYYDPASFQFISKDPARADGEQSAYQYCGGDPVGAVDPTGLRIIRIGTPTIVVSLAWCWRQWETVRAVIASAVMIYLFPFMAGPAIRNSFGTLTLGSITRYIGYGAVAGVIADNFNWVKENAVYGRSNAIKSWGNPRVRLKGKFVFNTATGSGFTWLRARLVINRTSVSKRLVRTLYKRGFVWYHWRRSYAVWR